MLEEVTLSNFRGFSSLRLEDMKPLTLLSGKNNVGKSSVLEGIFLYLDHISPDSFVKISNLRDGSIHAYGLYVWEMLFKDFDVGQKMSISVKENGKNSFLEYKKDDKYIPTNNGEVPQEIMNSFLATSKSTYTLQFHYEHGDYQEDGHFAINNQAVLRNGSSSLGIEQFQPMPPALFINKRIIDQNASSIQWMGELELKGKKEKVIDALKVIEPRINDISTIAANYATQLYVKLNDTLVPLKLAGDGMNTLLYIILSIMENPGSIILIDEIETGFHYSMYTKLWEVIAGLANDYNCQVIATTHSYECISGALEGIDNVKRRDDFCYYRLDFGTEIAAFRYSHELLCVAVEQEMEVR